MIHTQRTLTWRLLLAALLTLVAASGLFTARPAAAAPTGEGIDVSTMGNTADAGEGISPDGKTVCVAWGTFDLTTNGAYLRLYNTVTGTFTAAAPYRLAAAAYARNVHCAIDAAGNIHAVWEQKRQGATTIDVAYRMLPAGADPATGWRDTITVEENRDGPDIDALYADPNGQVWLAYRLYPGQFQVRSWKNGAWSGPQTVPANTNAEKARVGVDNAGFVHLAWRDGTNGVGYAYRDPATGQFSTPVVLPGSDRAGMVGLAVDRANGDVHLVFPKALTALYYTKKTGRTGTAFAAPRALVAGSGDDATQAIYTARIAWAANGRLVVAFDANGKGSIDALTSADRGATWDARTTLARPGGGAEGPWVVADGAGTGYVLYAHHAGQDMYFTTIPGTCATTFCDVPAGYWAYPQIEQFAQRGITTGCDTKLYCPERGVTRAEMAVFLERTLGDTAPPTPTSQRFTDVPSNYWAYAFIDQFAGRGVTTGCNATEYCPDRGVTRAEMAAFLIRALQGAQDTSPQIFADVPPTHPQYGYIQALYKRGITTGCGTNGQGQLLYCPDRGVTRAEMAVFITRAFPR